ncbi:MAG TPA: metallophosphoesterase [Dermatophilaceae bacterium]|nr:metallophosphoesterase [Dermatophilaceae bacterium]
MSGSSAEPQGAGVTLRTSGRSLRWRRPVIRGAELLVMVGAVYLGGVAATSLFPTTVETSHYSAEVRLSALPSFTSTIHSPTSFGDLDLKFTSPFLAPGVDATIQVRDTITRLFDDRRVSILALEPSSKEISDALGSGVTELGLKFSGGVLAVGFGAIALIAYARRRPPTLRQVLSTGVAALLAVGGTGAGVWGTYQPDQLSSFTTTGLLGTVRSNAGLLADVEARAAQVTPYVTNLLALSSALQEKFVPAGISEPPAARFLLVSDIHGANQYPLMKRIIDDEKVTAVIDSGDLINFGSVTEAELSGIFTAIENLGVPYLFVRGNHDASSLADQALLERMAKIANVVLLEPAPKSYTEVTVDGVVVAGFNDPRFFGDDSKNIVQKEQPAADAFNKAYADRSRPDIVVTHEPAAAKMVESATLLINGHLHKDELEGNRIGVGTFTGGGIMSHFLVPETGDQPGELAGQPYAFDIADYGQGCDLTSLTRYTFRNLIQGRPAYDSVSVLNGKTIATREDGERTCGTELGVSRTTVTLGG